MHRVSVIIPTFNQADFIPRAMQSVLDQSLAEWELLVVDDGSEDETEPVVGRYSDSRIHYARQDNAGPSAARNLGIARSSGEYVAFLDADDWWHPDLLAQLTSTLDQASSDTSVAHCDWCYCDATGTRRAHQSARFEPRAALSTLVLRNPIAIHSAVLRRTMIESINGFSESDLLEDWDLWLRIAQSGGGFVHVPRVLANYYWHSGSRSKDPTRRIRQRLATLDAFWAREPLASDMRRLEPCSYATAHIDACASWLAVDDAASAAEAFNAALDRHPSTAISIDSFYRLSHAQQSAFEGGQDGFESRMDGPVAEARITALLECARDRLSSDRALLVDAKRSANFSLAMASYNQGDLHAARRFFLQGFQVDSRLPTSRHVLLTGFKAFLPSGLLTLLRGFKGRFQQRRSSSDPVLQRPT
jgi:glycosyltransferase involved in cell wall biosynthesis